MSAKEALQNLIERRLRRTLSYGPSESICNHLTVKELKALGYSGAWIKKRKYPLLDVSVFEERALKARIRNRLGTHKSVKIPGPKPDSWERITCKPVVFEYNVLTVFSDHTFLEYSQWTQHKDEASLLAKCIRDTGISLKSYVTAYVIKRRVK